jgi:cytoskeletal protein CcmA (bactofilin family)
MLIADLKAKFFPSMTKQDNSNVDNTKVISKKLESISANFKSTPTIISRDLRIEGEITSSGLIEIEGNIKGTIKGNSVILRENGVVEGVIIAEVLSVRGKFDGTIRAKNLNIAAKAKITGTIEYDLLSVEDGACIDGQFKRLEK